MKKKLAIFVIGLGVVAAVIIGSFSYRAAQQEKFYAQTAVPYIKTVVPQLSTWNPDVARIYMSEAFLQKVSAENFDRIVAALSRLGTLESLAEPQFAESFSEAGAATIISYKVKAQYSSGPALITISLSDNAGELKIYRFNVESEALTM